jgi:predicted N-acyltransferase
MGTQISLPPFRDLRRRFLRSLPDCHSTTARTGTQPAHLHDSMRIQTAGLPVRQRRATCLERANVAIAETTSLPSFRPP